MRSGAAVRPYGAAAEAGKKMFYPWPLTVAEIFKTATEAAESEVSQPVFTCADALWLLYFI